MYLKEAVEDYLLYLQHERSATPATVRTYRPSPLRFVAGESAPRIRDSTALARPRDRPPNPVL